MAHAMDNSPPSTIILITGDRDFAYLVSILMLRQYHIIVIVPPNHHSSLTYQASVVLDWNTQVLQLPSNASTNPSASEYTLPKSVPQPPPQPFSFPNTFRVSSSKQASGTRYFSASRYSVSYVSQSPRNQPERPILVKLLPR